VFDFVNSYYEQVSPIIRTFKGFFVKYMGDGIMAVFPNRADDALQAAITKQRCVAEYNEHRLKKGDPPIQIGVGLHTGHMMVGVVGEDWRSAVAMPQRMTAEATRRKSTPRP